MVPNKIVGETIREINKNKLFLVKALVTPICVANVLYIIIFHVPYIIPRIIFGSYLIIQYLLIAVTTHRIILLGPKSVPEWGIFKLGFRDMYYAIHFVIISLVVILIAYGVSLVADKDYFVFVPTRLESNFWVFLIVVMSSWLLSRLFLVFPAIAVDVGVSFRLSWQLTENYQLLMYIVVVVMPVVMSIGGLIVYFMLSQQFVFHHTLIVNLFLYLLPIIALVIVIAALSIVFRIIYASHYDDTIKNVNDVDLDINQ